MNERTSQQSRERTFIPGLGTHALTPLYDLGHHVFGVQAIHREMIRLADARDGQRLLDVGCGTGNLLRSTGRQHPGVELVGMDPDPRALARAGRKNRRAGVAVQLDHGFAQELPYDEDAFDIVFSSLMLHHLDSTSKDSLLAEVHRVLRPDGTLILADARLDDRGRHHGRMHARMGDNVGDGVSRRIAGAGFTVAPTRLARLRVGGTVGIEIARPERH
jgi:ubiquinone/menaquinone biosynthesis C-methylase UbiE